MKINVNSVARKIDVDNCIPLRYYFRIADNLLKQASIYREENNIIDLYIILLRFSSLVSETIPFHQDYRVSLPKERATYKKRLLAVLDELESLKPEFQRRVDELNNFHAKAQLPEDNGFNKPLDSPLTSPMEWPSVSHSSYKQLQPAELGSQYSWNNNNAHTLISNSTSIDKQFQKLSLDLPLPKKETLSKHSFLGPNGFHGQWLGPSAKVKVQYPSSSDLTCAEDLSLDQAGQNELVAAKNADPGAITSTMDSVLSLDDRLHSAEEPCSPVVTESMEDPLPLLNIKQPSPPPVLAQVHHEYAPISPSKVADPWPGPAKHCQDSATGPATYQDLHVPVKMMQDFLRLALANTQKNLETCGVLAGSLCETLNEEELFEVQDNLSLFPLGWIHTHPSQTCFMSSVDLHTHYSYQIMLPEAIAIVMAPKDTTSPHGIFHLSDPSGVSVIRDCQQRGFHPHEEPLDGSPIYEHCSHVYLNPNMKFDIVDLRDR
ncbi:AMSH-like ubiquitin thioesterase 3 [Senna tora]|uniref:AMSH-like ubiquitin thioesterase 3 n=1 Tax=Senna tora TaxID=362788 RepID=A0A834T4A6_9FABA|nr:AMSH-like ubiquitin thioesterase 3 [Senna tora]